MKTPHSRHEDVNNDVDRLSVQSNSFGWKETRVPGEPKQLELGP